MVDELTPTTLPVPYVYQPAQSVNPESGSTRPSGTMVVISEHGQQASLQLSQDTGQAHSPSLTRLQPIDQSMHSHDISAAYTFPSAGQAWQAYSQAADLGNPSAQWSAKNVNLMV
jgi:hypothetical protein